MMDLSKLDNDVFAGALTDGTMLSWASEYERALLREAASRLQAPAGIAEVEHALTNAEKAVRAQSSPDWLQTRKGEYWDGYRDAIEDAAEDVAALRTGAKK